MEKKALPLSKESFVDIMTRYQETVDISNTVYDLYEKNERLFLFGGAVLPSIVDDVVDLLNIIFDLEEDGEGNSILDYWIREQDFGRKESNDYEFLFEGTKLPVGYSAEDIYDLICRSSSRPVL